MEKTSRERKVKVQEVVPGVFQVPVTTPFPGEEISHAYLLVDGGEACLVDAGAGYGRSRKTLETALEGAGVSPRRVARIVNTHEHVDHAGGDPEARGFTEARILMHPRALESIRNQSTWKPPAKLWERMDPIGRRIFEEGQRQFRELLGLPVEPLEEGGEVRVGGMRLRAIHTPGHAPGHLCLYEAGRRLLFTGDHVLGKGTPYVGSGEPIAGNMGDYYASLERLMDLRVDWLLPGHGPPRSDATERIRSTMESKRRREQKVLDTLRAGGTLSVPQISALVYADVKGMPKRFLETSTESYLLNLERQGVVGSEERGEQRLYRLSADSGETGGDSGGAGAER
ncbi:MAG: MBL fold metallo-hydrolase, partial [Euryarchaeota archaeon]|nr:MBL fold metallo-hydrolase [Euryarchaeota archaeon]